MAKVALVVSAGAVAIALVAAVIFMVVMMGAMMSGGHMGMMRGGSDPGSEEPAQGVTRVNLQDYAFVPANIVVDVGTTVTWTNNDNAGHTVTSDDGSELSSLLFGQTETFSHTFDRPGEYLYHCGPHPNMKGLVTVRAPGDG